MSTGLTELVQRLDEAVGQRNDETCCRRVKDALVGLIREGLDLDARFIQPERDHYARRLLHRDPAGRYTVIAMVWGPGQGTPLHDHAGIWCVECVYRGQLDVTSYSVRGGDPATGVVEFEVETRITAGIGEAGALIPPFEHHVLANAEPTPSVTIHVYGGEMTHCHVFVPVAAGGFRREFRELHYTPTPAA
jgi:predicted metal-dependent enzyme (double-stranded beta helix superfamily)